MVSTTELVSFFDCAVVGHTHHMLPDFPLPLGRISHRDQDSLALSEVATLRRLQENAPLLQVADRLIDVGLGEAERRAL